MSLIPEKLADGLYRFVETSPGGSLDAYLVVGSRSALVIDALQDEPGLYDAVRAITPLPVELVITHGHPDHAGVSVKGFRAAGCPVYMHAKDFDYLPSYVSYGPERDWFTHLPDGQVFDLGGRRLAVIYCGGHTAGSLTLLDSERQMLFTGDAVGSGAIWMQLPDALPLNIFVMNLTALYNRVRGMENLTLFLGHGSQFEGGVPGLQYLHDTLVTARRLVSGVWEGEDAVMDFAGRELPYKWIAHGQMKRFWYNPQNLRYGRGSAGEEIKALFTEGCFKKGSCCLGYMLFTPETQPGCRYPLVLYLHGAGERGSDLKSTLANPGATSFADPSWQAKHPCFVLAPQCAENRWWTDEGNLAMLRYALEEMEARFPVDPNRVYVTGLSMGGMGSWTLISRWPELFAAAMPVCGAGDPENVPAAKDVPVWAFHAVNDPVVPITGRIDSPLFPSCCGSRVMVSALRNAGNPNVRLTEYSADFMERQGLHGHAAWTPAYADNEAKEWLFSFSRVNRCSVAQLAPCCWAITDCSGQVAYLLAGREKALLVSVGGGNRAVLDAVRALTNLPVSLAANPRGTVHFAEEFEQVYLAKGLEKLALDAKKVVFVQNGSVIDLGGRSLTVIEAGCTPGELCFADNAACFCGEALTGALEAPRSYSLSEYQKSLEGLAAAVKGKGWEDAAFLAARKPEAHRPDCLEKAEDLAELCGLVLTEEADYLPLPVKDRSLPVFAAEAKQAKLTFTADRIR